MPTTQKKISDTVTPRLSIYLRTLSELQRQGKDTVSSQELAEVTHFTDAQIRKDLSLFGALGIYGTGYEVKQLRDVLSQALGIGKQWKVALVGVGNLGSALLAYHGFKEQGFNIVAVFDNDLTKVGKTWEGVTIQHVGELMNTVKSAGIKIGIIAVPQGAAQRVAVSLIQSEIECILNFAPARLKVPKEIKLRNVDLSIELEGFSCFLTNKSRWE